MRNSTAILGALGLGAGIMYFLDPDRGRRRRVMVADKALHLSKKFDREARKKAADVRNRVSGMIVETEKLFATEQLTDEQIEGRIRARLGHVCDNPSAIKTIVQNGTVMLEGHVQSDEYKSVRCEVDAIAGAGRVIDRLEIHDSKEDHPALRHRHRDHHTDRWSPAMRAAAASAGGGLLLFGLGKRNLMASFLSAAGIGLLARSAANRPLNDLLATGEWKAVHVDKTINIGAARDRLFDVLKYPQYFPNFMRHVRKVEPLGDRRFRWTVDGPFGNEVNWTVKITEVVPNEEIHWAGADGEEHWGFIRLETAELGTTRLHFEMNYVPAAGRAGQLFAQLFGADPKSILDDDFLRLKTYVEKGKLPRDAAARRFETASSEIRVADVMTHSVAAATVDTSLHDVAQMMADFDCGAIPVVDRDGDLHPVGMITDRDLALRTVAHNKNPLTMIAGEVMTDNVIAVNPGMNVEECIEKMELAQVRRIAVVDEAGKLCGMISQSDIALRAPAMDTAELVRDISLVA